MILSQKSSAKTHWLFIPKTFTPGLITLELSTLVYGSTDRNQWYMTVWKRHNRTTHTPFGQHTNELTALLENPVLINTKNFYPRRLFISTLSILHQLTNSPAIPPLPLPGTSPCATFPIVFVVVLLILLPSPSPCFWFLIGLVIFPPNCPGGFFVSVLVAWLADGSGAVTLFHFRVWGIYF